MNFAYLKRKTMSLRRRKHATETKGKEVKLGQ